jgi:hypothetical protein
MIDAENISSKPFDLPFLFVENQGIAYEGQEEVSD